MSDFYIFEGATHGPTQASAERYVALFSPNLKFDAKAGEEALVQFLPTVRAPGNLYLVGFEPGRDGLIALAGSRGLHDRLPLGTGSLRERIHCLLFNADGTLQQLSGTPVDQNLIQAIRNDGLRHMFSRHKGMVHAKPNTHFVKPSGDHADCFIRVANVLRQGEEIAFMAAWLLPHLKPTTTYIQCDSATIACVAYALINLKRSLVPDFTANPRVRSFGSYSGLEDEFPEPGTSLMLISASTTGRLTDKLIEYGAMQGNIITLYSLAAEQLVKNAPTAITLCALDWEPERTPKGYAKIRNQSARKCSFCLEDHSHRIHISPDTFIPEAPEAQIRTIIRNDQPAELKEFLDLCAGRGVVRCYYRPKGNPNGTQEIHLNATQLVTTPSQFLPKFMASIDSHLAIRPELVIHLNDDASRTVADALVTECGRRGYPTPEVIDYRHAVRPQADFAARSGPIWVVTSAMVGGRRLSDLSRKLRGFTGEIVYLCAVTRTSSAAILNELKSNLTYRAEGKNYAFLSQANIHLPRPNMRMSSWDRELAFLKRLRAASSDLPQPLEERFELLRTGSENNELGLSKTLFWKTPKGESLVLRPNFAFYTTPEGVQLSQADVYLVVTTILHKLRTDPKPLQLLSPGNFDRFNDGVIQAALLRAALPAELNYALSEFHSDYLCDLMCFMLHEPMGGHSEALPEFIWALVDQKLRLTHDHHMRVLSEIEKCTELPTYLKKLAASTYPPEEATKPMRVKMRRLSVRQKTLSRKS